MKVIDADGHVFEPLDDEYYSSIEEPYRSWPGRPQFVKKKPGQGVKGESRYWYEGRVWPNWPQVPGNPLGLGATQKAGISGGRDPHIRLKDMDAMEIDVAVLYPGVMLFTLGFGEPDYEAAYARAYNNWLAKYCEADPGRLRGVAVVALEEVKESMKEVRRCSEDYGFVGVTTPYFAKGTNPYNPLGERRRLDHPDFDPFWEECQRLNIAVGPHLIPMVTPYWFGADLEPNYFTWRAFVLMQGAIFASMCVICGGVLKKFPRLRFAFLESGIG